MNIDLQKRKLAGIIVLFRSSIGVTYRTGANKGRGLYSKKILWSIGAAYKQERLQLKKNFLKRNQSFNSQNLL